MLSVLRRMRYFWKIVLHTALIGANTVNVCKSSGSDRVSEIWRQCRLDAGNMGITDSRTCKTRVQVGVENDVARFDVSVHDYGLENGRIGSMKELEAFDCAEEHR